MYQMYVPKYPEYSKWPYNLIKFFNLRSSKICPNWDFWLKKQTIWQPRFALDNFARPWSQKPYKGRFYLQKAVLVNRETVFFVLTIRLENLFLKKQPPLFYGPSVYFWCILCPYMSIFCGHLVYFMDHRNILRPFGTFCVHLVDFVAIW
jgi:hypothetical protein